MPIEILLYDLVDWGGNVERQEAMTPREAKRANKKLWEKEPRLIRWIISNENYRYIKYRRKYPNELFKNK